MSVKCSKISVNRFLFYVLFVYQQFSDIFTANIETLEGKYLTPRLLLIHTYIPVPFFTSCQLPNETEGYCVPVKNCQLEIKTLTGSDLETKRCGPSNENRKNPLICCETNMILFSKPDSTNQTTKKCGIQNLHTITGNRIFGGDIAEQGEFPWLARILRRNVQGDLVFGCTGTLIHPRVVLTAAHCLTSEKLVETGELYAVTLGEHKTKCDSPENTCLINKESVMVEEYVVHPEYDSNSNNHANDIGLIILKKNVTSNDYISLICLLEKSVNVVEYNIAGWGRTNTQSTSIVKRKTTIPPYSWTKCSAKYKKVDVNLTKNQICAGGVKGKDTCQGDSGGPLMIELEDNRWYIAGVVSIGVGCGTEEWPGIYINVPSYVEWIKEVIKVKLP